MANNPESKNNKMPRKKKKKPKADKATPISIKDLALKLFTLSVA